MLGTNDAKDFIATSPADYNANMQFVIDTLAANGVTKIVINQPPYIQPSGTGIPNPTLANARLVTYQAQNVLLASANPGLVFLGDATAYSVFQSNPSYYQADGIHPNDTGATALANLWAAVYPI